jgi:hypothetical protein
MDGGGRKLTGVSASQELSYLGKSGPDESTLLSSGKISPSSSAKLTGKKSKVIGIKRNVK